MSRGLLSLDNNFVEHRKGRGRQALGRRRDIARLFSYTKHQIGVGRLGKAQTPTRKGTISPKKEHA